MSNADSRIHPVAQNATTTTAGLPARTRVCLFDLDGVLTDTAKLHAAAWKEVFDGYLTVRAQQTGDTFVAFDEVADYDTYVDGMSRADGTRSFLRSRGTDGITVTEQQLVGKPAPDTYRAAAKVLVVKPGSDPA